MTTKKKLPAPRLQLRWGDKEPDDGWPCHYELVIPLKSIDVRAEIWKNGRQLRKTLKELAVPIKEPTYRQGGGVPCTDRDGIRYCDTPFRDGAHAQWDAAVLGNPPIYVIAPDGETFLVGFDK